MLNEYRYEGGFIGEHRYNAQSLDQANARYEEITEKIERHNDDLQTKFEVLDNDTA